MNKIRDVVDGICSLMLLLVLSAIGVCITVMVLSATVECVTGYSLINDTIKPAVNNCIKNSPVGRKPFIVFKFRKIMGIGFPGDHGNGTGLPDLIQQSRRKFVNTLRPP